MGGDKSCKSKDVELFDEWEQFSIRFSIFYPIQNDQTEYLVIQGSLEELGSGKKPIKMLRRPNMKSSDWLSSKYGQEIRPWECLVHFNSAGETIKEFPATITYKYFKQDDSKHRKIGERVAHRKIEIRKPENYHGARADD